MSTVSDTETHVGAQRATGRTVDWWYVGAVVTGAVLIVIAAINQPFNQNELRQIAPYGGNTVAEITSGTRQPPLDPVLGAILQHLLGEGQVRQRLVAILSGTGTLVVMALLLRRMRLGGAGAFALWVLATAPLLVRYSAYTRPYALPVFLMVLFVYAAERWLSGTRHGWLSLSLAAVAAVGLPLARVVEPIVFLASVTLALAYLALRGRFGWRRVSPLLATTAGSLVLVGYPMYHALTGKVSGGDQQGVGRVLRRVAAGVYELVTGFTPLMAEWFPWWPVTVLMVVACLSMPAARRRLAQWWFLGPLVLPAVAWVLLYHFLSPYPLEELPYRPRSAVFFMPAYTLVVAALAAAVTEAAGLTRRLRHALVALLAATLVGQLPTTATILVDNQAADYEQAADVLVHDLPKNAIVLYDTPSPAGWWHQPFSGRPKYMGDTPYVAEVSGLMRRPEAVPSRGPVFVLILDSECAFSTLCNEPPAVWDHDVAGWQVKSRFDRFTLYEPTTPRYGERGTLEATKAFAAALGPDLGAAETFTAAALMNLRGHPRAGRALIRDMYAKATPEAARRIRANAEQKHLNPFQATP